MVVNSKGESPSLPLRSPQRPGAGVMARAGRELGFRCSIMVALRPYLVKLLESLPPPPAQQHQLQEIVKKTLLDARHHAYSENWKSQWEYLLKAEIFKLAVSLVVSCGVDY